VSRSRNVSREAPPLRGVLHLARATWPPPTADVTGSESKPPARSSPAAARPPPAANSTRSAERPGRRRSANAGGCPKRFVS
jgi:hypothetical protein